MNTSSQGPPGPAASPAKFQHWRQQTDVVQDVAALQDIIVNFTGGDVPQQLHAARVSADYFRLLGAPIRGRSFSPEEDLPNGQKVLVMSHGLWSGRFASSPDMLGKTVSIDGHPYTVIGIMGPSFDLSAIDSQPDVWIPFQLDPNP